MIDKFLRDIINLLLYGGAFIGLCAACITALSFDLIGNIEYNQFNYILLVGTSTAALYSGHHVISLFKFAHINNSEKYRVIRMYKNHIWTYCVVWVLLSIWLFIPLASIEFILWLLPGGIVAISYVLPVFSKGRKLRDFGWTKVIFIGWSWAWLTAFLPALYFGDEPVFISSFMGVGRMLFIVAISIPFEIRDIFIDKSVDSITMPVYFGIEKTIRIGMIFCIFIILFVSISSFHYHDSAYGIAMSIISLLTLWIIKKSHSQTDDYFFSGLTDGTMIMALILYWVIQNVI